ncbi:hypothetical protein QE152_g27407 [Popillia japonica]|uniref:Uncharacterized protein n=1 Tax=Popillia japonica TaxID=7064 RepID=A0AAW1JVL1_POPJA
MLRTPPRVTPSFSRLPLPESPENHTNQACDAPTHDTGRNDDTLTPRNLGLPPSEEDLSDDEILAQIKRLQATLLKRRNKERSTTNDKLSRGQNSDDEGSPSGVSPLTMDTSFGSTSSLVSAVHRNIGRKRKGSSSPASSPARRLRVSAQIHAPVDAEPSGSKTSPHRPAFDRKATRPLHPSADADDAIVSLTLPTSQPETRPANGQRRFPPTSLRSKPDAGPSQPYRRRNSKLGQQTASGDFLPPPSDRNQTRALHSCPLGSHRGRTLKTRLHDRNQTRALHSRPPGSHKGRTLKTRSHLRKRFLRWSSGINPGGPELARRSSAEVSPSLRPKTSRTVSGSIHPLKLTTACLQNSSPMTKYHIIPTSYHLRNFSMLSMLYSEGSRSRLRRKKSMTIFVSEASSRIRSLGCAGPETRHQCHLCWSKYPKTKRRSTISIGSSPWRFPSKH